jgi:hypothetical protein
MPATTPISIDPALRNRLIKAVVLLIAVYFISIGFTTTTYVNCRLTQCGWFDFGKIGVGIAAIVMMYSDQRDASEAARWHPLALALRAAVALAGLYMAVHGAGLVGPAPCALVKPGC